MNDDKQSGKICHAINDDGDNDDDYDDDDYDHDDGYNDNDDDDDDSHWKFTTFSDSQPSCIWCVKAPKLYYL